MKYLNYFFSHLALLIFKFYVHRSMMLIFGVFWICDDDSLLPSSSIFDRSVSFSSFLTCGGIDRAGNLKTGSSGLVICAVSFDCGDSKKQLFAAASFFLYLSLRALPVTRREFQARNLKLMKKNSKLNCFNTNCFEKN